MPVLPITTSNSVRTLGSWTAGLHESFYPLQLLIRRHSNIKSVALFGLNIGIVWILQYMWSSLFVAKFPMSAVFGIDDVQFLRHIGSTGRYLHLAFEVLDLLYFIPSVAIFHSCLFSMIFTYLHKRVGDIACWVPSIYFIFGVLEHIYDPLSTTRYYILKASKCSRYKWISLILLCILVGVGMAVSSCKLLCNSCDMIDLDLASTRHFHDDEDESGDDDLV